MDKKSFFIGITLFILAVLWPFLVASIWQPPPNQSTKSNSAQNTQNTAQSPAIPTLQAPPPPDDLEIQARLFQETPTVATLENDLIKIDFSPIGTGIRSVTLKTHESENGERVLLNQHGTAPILGISGWDDGSYKTANIRAQKTDNAVRFSHTTPGGLQITKTYQLVPEEKTYRSRASITITNPLERTVTIPKFFLNIGTSGPIHRADMPYHIGTDFGGPRGIHHKKITDFHAGFFGMRPARSIIEETLPLRWITSRNQYFLTFLRCEKSFFEGFRAVHVKLPPLQDGTRPEGVQTFAHMASASLAPGDSITWNFDLYTGPREYSQLKALGERAQLIMEYGWFGLVSVFLGWLMTTFHSWLGSYGLAIILMVLTVRAILWPLQNQANKTMKAMQALAPKMKEVQDKYKDNPQRMNEEIMALYSEYGVNPLGGCLPVLVQIPVFFGFYAMLQSAVQLRYESFLWIRDLSQPDTIYVIPGLELPINLLPILMGATSLWQMNITPMTTTDKFQTTLFKLMPLIFVVICYNFSSALALYWTVQNLVGVAQIYYNLGKPAPKLEKRSKNKPKTRWQLMMEQARIMAEEERKRKLAKKK
jgi:YidC/Oxa1 family membrane protein insertase